MQDTDPMPFGMHINRPMQDVPAGYFHFLWTLKGFKDNMDSSVADYIRRNLDALKKENSDLIWN